MDEAEKAFKTCLEKTLTHCIERDAAKVNSVRADCLCGLGSVLMDMGKLDESLATFRDASTLSSVPKFVIDCLCNMATCHRRLGQWTKAFRLYDRCKEREPEDPTIWSNIAGLLKERGELLEALECYQKCVQLDKKRDGETHASYATSLHHVGLMRMELGQYTEALEDILTAREILSNALGKHHSTTSAVSRSLADCWLAFQNFDEALIVYEDCRVSQEKALGHGHPEVCETLVHASLCLLKMKRSREALDYATRAAEHMLSFLVKIWPGLPEAKQVAFSQNYNTAVLNLPAAMLGSTCLPEKAIRFLMLRKCLQWEFQACTVSSPPAQQQELMQARQALARLAYQSFDERRFEDLTPLMKRIEELEVDTQGHCKLNASWLDGVCPQKQLFQKMTERLLPSQALLDYYVFLAEDCKPRYCSFLWLPRSSNSIQPHPILIDLEKTDVVNKLLRDFHANVFSKKKSLIQEGVKVGKELRKAILDPILSLLPAEITYLYICPDGELASLAFCCLPIDSVHQELPRSNYDALLHRFAVSYLHAGHRLMKGAAEPCVCQGRWRALAFANPDFGGNSGWSKLDHTQAEAACLEGIFQQPVLLQGKEATREAFLAQIKDAHPSVIHVATHGCYRSEESRTEPSCLGNPLLRCCLIAAGGERITGLDLLGSDLRGTFLATLSCCYSACGDVRPSEGAAGFAYVLSAAGVEHCMVSVHEIDDKEGVVALSCCVGV